MIEAGSVLFIDDDPNWAELLQVAFLRAGIPNAVQTVRDGPEAISYFRGEGRYANRRAHPLPRLVLVDLRLPGMNGFEVLKWIRRHPTLGGLPVVVVTGMETPGDVRRAHELGASGFLPKPFSFAKQIEMAQTIRDNWLRPGQPRGKRGTSGIAHRVEPPPPMPQARRLPL
jgi:CheY-like chemotaxis protein